MNKLRITEFFIIIFSSLLLSNIANGSSVDDLDDLIGHVDWCSSTIQEELKQELKDGENYLYLKVLGFTPIDYVPFTEGQIRQLLIDAEAIANEQREQGEDPATIASLMYIEKDPSSGIDYIFIVDDEDSSTLNRHRLGEFITYLNNQERDLNLVGLSLRGSFADGDKLIDPSDPAAGKKGLDLYAVFNDPVGSMQDALQDFRTTARMKVEACVNQIPADLCPVLLHDDIYNNLGLKKNTKITLDEWLDVDLATFINASNVAAMSACGTTGIIFGYMGDPIFTSVTQDYPNGGTSGYVITQAKLKQGVSLSADEFANIINGRISLLYDDLTDSDWTHWITYISEDFKSDMLKTHQIPVYLQNLSNDTTEFFKPLRDLSTRVVTAVNDYASETTDSLANFFGMKIIEDSESQKADPPKEGDDDIDWGEIWSDVQSTVKDLRDNYRSLERPTPPPLEVTHSRPWRQELGNSDNLAAYIETLTELRMGEQEIDDISKAQHAYAHYARAYAEAGISFRGEDHSLLGVAADAYVGLDKVSANFDLTVIGYNWPKDEGKWGEPLASITETHTWQKSESVTFATVIFPVGPIPVRLEASAFSAVGLQQSYGLVSLKVYAQSRPFAKSGLTASASIDIVILAVGATASITVVDASVPLTAQAALIHDEAGRPYLSMELNGSANIRMLDGHVSVWAKYYVPAASIPPWKKKRVNRVLFEWEGFGSNLPIFAFGVDVSRSGVNVHGDPLTLSPDQIDEGNTLRSKAGAINDYQSAVENRILGTIGIMVTQINALDNQALSDDANTALFVRNGISDDINRYKTEMINMFNAEDPKQRDTDGDGVTDQAEWNNGTIADNPDSDGDGLPDGYELSHANLDAENSADAIIDTDGDGFTNLEEFSAGSDPNNVNITPDNIIAILMVPILSLLLN